MTPEECSAEIIRQLVSQALLETNVSEIEGTAITIPAAFNQMQSEATLRAARAAGLDRVVLLQEPIAAAMAQANSDSGQFLVYDLGGGTFDLALVQSLSGQPIIQKGTPLPANGSQPLKAAYGVGPSLPGHIDLELFQDENARDPDLNLAIGSFRISHHDLPEGLEIKEGDPVIFHWAMDDSGLLTASVELPSLQQTFSSKRFYVDQAGHHSFDGDAGEKLVETTISVAEAESAEVVKAVGAGAKQELDDVEQKLEEQRRRLGAASSGDERRSITESVRHIRQQVARLRLQPEHRGRYLELKLNDLISRYNELARPEKPTPQSERLDQQAAAAANELKRRTDAAFDLADVIIDQMDTIYWRTLWQKADFVRFMFDRASKQRHLAANKETFDLLLADGENAVKAGDVDELRIIVLRMWDNQITTENISGDIRKLASVLRG